MKMKVSVLIPTLNEEKGIGITLDQIKKGEFDKKKWELELVIVDGGSKDRTEEVAKSKGAKIIVEPRKGYGRAYKTGMKKVTGDVIVTGDADATYPFDEMHSYIQELLDNDWDFISTNRFAKMEKSAMSVKHRFGNFILSTTLRILFGINIKDSQSGMWIFKKKALEKINLDKMDDGMPFSEELKIEMFSKVKSKEIPSTLYVRRGEAKLESFKDGWENLKFLFKKRISE
jgi:hypothetical protein